MSIDEETLGRFRPHMDKCRTPGAYDKVHNDECVYSFDTLSPRMESTYLC